jgi:hypothetical protein
MADRSDDNGRPQFSPGASFTDDDPDDDIEVSELPSWLQSFASSVDVDEAETEVPATPVVEAPVAPGADDPTIPGWLSGPREDSNQGGLLSSPGGTSFFSEDDLPEWLRALSSEQPADARDTGFGLAEDSLDELSTPPAIQVLTAPSVSNVWVTGMEDRLENPAAVLFSVIATSGTSRPELAMAAAPRVGQNKADRAATQAQDVEPARASRGGWSRRERILLIAVIVMLILLLIVLNGNFGG